MTFWEKYDALLDRENKLAEALQKQQEERSDFLRTYMEEHGCKLSRGAVPYRIVQRGETFFMRRAKGG
jgi:hypothetical protein